jgi:hypothetical protein
MNGGTNIRYAVLFSFLFTILLVGSSHIVKATGSPATINSIISSVVTNITVAQQLESNGNLTSYLSSNPQVLISLLNNSVGVNAILTNGRVVSLIDSNGTMLITFLSNPSVGSLMSDPAPFIGLMNDPRLVSITDNPLYLSALVSNPSIAAISSNYSRLVPIIENTNFYTIAGNETAYYNFLSNPSIVGLMSNSTPFYNFLNLTTNPFLTNQQALGNLLSNPTLPWLLSNSSFTTFINVTQYRNGSMYLLESPQFVSFISNPKFSWFIANSSQAFLYNPKLLTDFLDRQQSPVVTSTIINNPSQIGTLLANPSLVLTISYQSNLAQIITQPDFQKVLNTPTALNSFLGNPGLGRIVENPNEFDTFMGTAGSLNFTSDQLSLVVLLENPSLDGAMQYPNGLTYLINSLTSIGNNGQCFSSAVRPGTCTAPAAAVLLDSLSSSSFSTVLNNSQGFVSTLQTIETVPSGNSVVSNITELAEFINNPALGKVIANPAQLSTFFTGSANVLNATPQTQASLTALLSNPNIVNITSNPSAFDTFLQNAKNNPSLTQMLTSQSLTAMFSNPSLGSVMNSQSESELLELSKDNYTGPIFSNASVLASFIGNPGLGNILNNPGNFTNFKSGLDVLMSNSHTYFIASDPILLGSLLSNPNIYLIINNQTLQVLLFNDTVAGVFTNGPSVASLLSNPSLSTILHSPVERTNLGRFVVNRSVSNFVNSEAFSALLSNPKLSDFLEPNNQVLFSKLVVFASNPAIASQLNNASFDNFIASPAFINFINNPSFDGLVNNQIVINLMSNPSANIYLGDNSSTNLFANPSVAGILSDKYVSTMIDNPILPNILSSSEISRILSNPEVDSLLSGGNNYTYAGRHKNSDVTNTTNATKFQPSAPDGTGDDVCSGIVDGIESTVGEVPADCEEGSCADPFFCTCVTVAAACDFTTYDQGGIGITTLPSLSSLTGAQPTPVIQAVLSNNHGEDDGDITNGSAQLITCPEDPDPTNSTLFFVTDPTSYIAGDACLSSVIPTVTVITLTTDVSWSLWTPAYAYDQSWEIGGPDSYPGNGWGTGTITNLAYSGEATNTTIPALGSVPSNDISISDGYDTQSYIFGSVPTSSQYGIWTWSATYPNLNQTDLDDLNTTYTLSGIEWDAIVCDYLYDYTVTSAITSINNTNITTPQFNRSIVEDSSNDWLKFAGYYYSGVDQETDTSGDCYPALANGIDCGGWIKVSSNGTMSLGGDVYNGLNIYFGTMTGTASSDPSAQNGNSIIAIYEDGYGEVDATAINDTNVTAFPVISYTYGIPTIYTVLNDRTDFLNNTYNVYSPHNYIDPANYLDPFPLNTGSGLFVTYNNTLMLLPFNITATDGSNNSNSFAQEDTDFLGTFNKPSSQKVSFGATNYPQLGQLVDGNIPNPEFITAALNGYIYVINYSSSGGFFSTTKTSDIFVLKFIPQGDYIPSYTAPLTSSATSYDGIGSDVTKSRAQFIADWENYSYATYLEESQPIYILAIDKLASSETILGGAYIKDNGGKLNNFQPLAVQTDDSGDLFILGEPTSSGFGLGSDCSASISGSCFGIVDLAPPGSANELVNLSINKPAGFIPSDEFAVAPGGEYVYVANVSSNVINIYLTQTTSGLGTTSTTTTAASTTTTTITSTGTCPNSDSAGNLTFAQVVACATQAGFSGNQEYQIVSIAYQESTFRSSASGAGVTCKNGQVGANAQGILQEGASCSGSGPSTTEAFPLPGYSSPSQCTGDTAGTWVGVYDDPACAFQWAEAYTQSSGASSCGVEDPYCFWGAYLSGAYCKYAPISYSGWGCNKYNSTNDGENLAKFPWTSTTCVGSCSGGGGYGSGSGYIGCNGACFTYSGNIPLVYSSNALSSNAPILNIAKYMADGGPYNDSTVAQAYSSCASANVPDQPSFHHPVAMAVSKGILYVADNWSFSINCGSGGTLTSSILMLRAFGPDGTEIPINPSHINTTMLITPTTSSNSPAINNLNIIRTTSWAPYGWPLSANISIGSGSGSTGFAAVHQTKSLESFTGSTSTSGTSSIPSLTTSTTTSTTTTIGGGSGSAAYYISYCAYFCDNEDPSAIKSDYPPIGPAIAANGGFVGQYSNSLSITSDFNGTLYLLAKVESYSDDGGGDTATVGDPLYTELLVISPDIQNYTKVDLFGNSSYVCYINDTGDTDMNTPCEHNANTAILQYVSAPLLGIPSAFAYAESLGTPEQFLGAAGIIASAIPGISNSSKYQNESNAFNNETGTGGGFNYTKNLTNFSTSSKTQNLRKNTYLRSSVAGNVLIPYNFTVELDQSWNFYMGESLFPPIPCPQFPFESDTSSSYFKYATLALGTNPVLSSYPKYLNVSVEGGPTYLEQPPLQTPYIQNLSDAALIISPYLNYEIYTNRLFGEVYINQTVSPSGINDTSGTQTVATDSSRVPLIVNASQTFKYQVAQYQQYGLGDATGSYAYDIEEAIPIPVSTGTNCTGFSLGSLTGSNYYSCDNAYGGATNMTYQNYNLTSFVSIYNQIQEENRVANLTLSFNLSKNTGFSTLLGGSSNLLGYNRLVFTYVDRFNNTIYMPLDVDFANQTQFTTVSATPSVNATNTNETIVNITGTVSFQSVNGTQIPVANANVYLYWNTNINYYNKSGSSSSFSPSTNYYKWALRCAEALNSSSGCTLADPLSTQTQGGIGAQIANTTNYQQTSPCPQPPSQFMLTTPAYNCNLYNNYGLSSVQSGGSGYSYCVPYFPNGTGLFTTQLGLANVVTTNANGTFSATIAACGIGLNRVIAYYYGDRPPEPVNVSQTWLGASGGADEFGKNIDTNDVVNTPEYNYDPAPGQTTAQVQTGSYSLSFGSLGLIGIIAAGAIVVVLLYRSSRKNLKGKKAR